MNFGDQWAKEFDKDCVIYVRLSNRELQSNNLAVSPFRQFSWEGRAGRCRAVIRQTGHVPTDPTEYRPSPCAGALGVTVRGDDFTKRRHVKEATGL